MISIFQALVWILAGAVPALGIKFCFSDSAFYCNVAYLLLAIYVLDEAKYLVNNFVHKLKLLSLSLLFDAP